MSAAVLEMSASASAAERLADFARVATDDVDEAAEQIGRIFCPHDLKPAQARAAGFSARHNCAAFDGFSINYVTYGGSVSIDPGCLERFFLLQVPLTGTARIRAGAGDFDAVPDRTASLLSPTIPTRMMWSDCAQVILLLDRRMVEQRAAALSGRVAGTVEFDPVIDLDAPSGRALRTSLGGLMTLAERLGPSGRLSPVATADWREALLDHLLNGQRHGLSDAIRTFSGQAERLPRALRVARDRLADNAGEPLDLAQLACAAGIGIRALQLGFRRHFGVSISEMLLDMRLAGLHARLAQARPDASITEIAFDLGFTHLGRMAGAYREKFGETPSATLRRRMS
ncbi:AraC family transcriptional regulator [Bradyrhizobium diazoefficiens]|uniref:Transcriptional regulatory protein n=1 Tax=Bradyrhizobium diazoefficiens (strain JCM 10833 / BCRC 13528 / IAM 13628 / NBRC 14792 / USDA 110) TaxID=224911 RepID=Q89FI3_BRADU|nr:AraC family transcriptional regulator [Bradyrhizobium diazoefficiens]AND91741.1 transcriptional regulator [Bradyrhizobium diazoefficiens USDA 110]QBP25460.1 AraC family transcriptional regulator [Bradyrhizobium diazoefficiens]QLD41671.1 AraC family transcriptional regulator [Bradyrhizobium diazoefficiens]WLB36866.1 AraC family transcriptional regulator [Bradyrhizobium diazoefficiens]WLC18213.1 AraC family transcriptional regulator [Bradyrhizobium diazoefficiens]